MKSDIVFPLIALAGLTIIWIVIKYTDKSIADAKEKGEEVKNDGCANMGCLIGAILVAIGFIAINIQECSHGSHGYHHDINLESPIHPDR